MRQQSSLVVQSVGLSPAELTSRIGLSPGATATLGSRTADPPGRPIPASNRWELHAIEVKYPLDHQINGRLNRLGPAEQRIAQLTRRQAGGDPDTEGVSVGLSIARHFNDPVGVEEIGDISAGRFVKLSGPTSRVASRDRDTRPVGSNGRESRRGRVRVDREQHL
jgi:hypothetical protein